MKLEIRVIGHNARVNKYKQEAETIQDGGSRYLEFNTNATISLLFKRISPNYAV